MIGRDRHALRATVAQRRLEIDKAADPSAPRRIQYIDCTDNVGGRVLAPVPRILVSGSTVDDVGRCEAREGLVDGFVVGNRSGLNREAGQIGQSLAPTGREIVDYQDLVAPR